MHDSSTHNHRQPSEAGQRRQALTWGAQAEEAAARHLITRGYTIRERNWRCAHLEIDIIAQRHDTIIFAEVKARTDSSQDPADALDTRKMRRLSKAADAYLAMQTHDYSYRFDIITVSGTPDAFTLDHIEDAFLPPLSTR